MIFANEINKGETEIKPKFEFYLKKMPIPISIQWPFGAVTSNTKTTFRLLITGAQYQLSWNVSTRAGILKTESIAVSVKCECKPKRMPNYSRWDHNMRHVDQFK